jgi:hypothetical protein
VETRKTGRTTRDVPYATRGGLKFTIPTGTAVYFDVKVGDWLVRPEAFDPNSIEHHDATYYGLHIPADAVDEMP